MVPTWARELHGGKSFIRVSLKTEDAAEARRRSLQVQADWARTFEEQRILVAPATLMTLTPEMLQHLCERIRWRILHADDSVRFDPAMVRRLLAAFEEIAPAPRFLTANDGPPPYLFEQHPDGLSPAQLERLRYIERALSLGMLESLAFGRTAMGRAFADHEARLLGLTFDWDQQRPALLTLTRTVVSAYLEAFRRSHGEPVLTPPEPEVPEVAVEARVAALPVAKTSTSMRSLRDVMNEWKVVRKAKADAVGKTERAVRMMEEADQSVLLVDIDRAAGLAFKRWLIDDARPFAENTAGKHFQAIMALLNFAAQDLVGWLPNGNPWRGIEAPRGRAARRTPWDSATLGRLFASQLHQSYVLPDDPRASGAAAYWVPLLGAFSGARLAELCNLRLVDIVERDGVLLLDINEEGGGSVKSDAGVRTVPVHPELIRLGFQDYVDDRRKAGETLLFSLYEQPSRSAATYQSDWFRKLRQTQGVAARWQDFHALRTTVSTKLRGVHPALNESLILALLGHEGSNTGQVHYTHHDPLALQRALENLVYQGLSLPRVYPTR
jgi:integrase